ncbi:MAG: CrcB family protein [bacterium]|nr:CrcB family protein [bacterium]
MNWIFLGLGGALGALSRHFVGAGVLHLTGWRGHWGTTVVNITGCFIIGLFSTLVGLRLEWGLQMRYFFFTGFLGAYTTFSTYMLENFLLLEKGHPYLAALNALGGVVVGFLALWGGISLAKTLI